MWNVVHIHRSWASPSPRHAPLSRKFLLSSHVTKPAPSTGRSATTVSTATSTGTSHARRDGCGELTDPPRGRSARGGESLPDGVVDRRFERTEAGALGVFACEGHRASGRLDQRREDRRGAGLSGLYVARDAQIDVVRVGAREPLGATAIDVTSERRLAEPLMGLEPGIPDDPSGWIDARYRDPKRVIHDGKDGPHLVWRERDVDRRRALAGGHSHASHPTVPADDADGLAGRARR